MKKFLSLLIIINFTFNPALAEIIEDSFAKASLNTDLKIKNIKPKAIEDDFSLNSLNQNLKIAKPITEPIVDDFALRSLNPDLKIKKAENIKIKDSLVENLKITSTKRNYASIEDVKISPAKYYTTKSKIKEGDYIDFVLLDDIKINQNTYKQGTIIKGRVENITKNGAYGLPADLVVDNFVINNETYLNGTISKRGADRALWVYPLSYVLLPFFGLGLFIFPIRGGHAKLKPKQIYVIGD